MIQHGAGLCFCGFSDFDKSAGYFSLLFVLIEAL